jgi:hypothetical protein
VANICRMCWAVGGGGWRWHRELFAWKEQLVLERCIVLKNLFLQVDALDKWTWLPDPTNNYSVRGAYHLLTHLVPVIITVHKDIIWNKVVLLKVSLFSWRLLNDRLHSKDNLVGRGCLLRSWCVV